MIINKSEVVISDLFIETNQFN